MTTQKVLIAGQWREANHSQSFQAEDPKATQPIDEKYPVSDWADCDAALDAAVDAFKSLRTAGPKKIADFLDEYANRIENRSSEICELASCETALPVEPRFASGELPRTTNQLRQAATAAREQSWCQATIDTEPNIRSCYGAIGPVAVFGPNNFPMAFGSVSGGDFAAAIAAGNPVIGKANPMHPGTTRLFAEEALQALEDVGLPPATVQLVYRIPHELGEQLAQDRRLAAIGYTGSRSAGLKLKAAADAVGKPIYLELSSVNPVFLLSNVLSERGEDIAAELTSSCLMGTGQFCTNPGLVVLPSGTVGQAFADRLVDKFQEASTGTLLSESGQGGLANSIETLKAAGAEVLCGGEPGGGEGYSYQNTVMQVSGDQFLANPEELQTEAFGNCTMLVTASSIDQMVEIAGALEGNLTGCLYSASDGSDDGDYERIEAPLRMRVGRLLNDKMPTGVAVCPAMNHGGPYPATGHPGFTAVGIPRSIQRFAMLQCYDNVRPHRLPDVLNDENPGNAWRMVDGQWTREDVAAAVAAR